MKKSLLVLIFIILTIGIFSKTVIGAYGWSDIFIGFDGYGIYSGIQTDIPIEKIYDLKKNFGIDNDFIRIVTFYGGGLDVLNFDPSVLGVDDSLKFSSIIINGKAKLGIGLSDINFTLFGYKFIPVASVGLKADYYLNKISEDLKPYIDGSVLGDNIVITPTYGIEFITDPIDKNKKYVIKPLFFPWPLMLGVEVTF